MPIGSLNSIRVVFALIEVMLTGVTDQYGFAVRNWMPEWVMWVWQNGSDVLSPDGRRASGYLDAPATIEAIQWFTDLVKRHRVAPRPSVLESFGSGSAERRRLLAGRQFALPRSPG